MRPNHIATLIGTLFSLPFLFLNTVVSQQLEPLFSWIRPEQHTTPLEMFLLTTSTLAILGGAYIAASPLFKKGVDGKREFYILNTAVALALLTAFLLLAFSIGHEIYRCEFLQLKSCD